MSLMQQLINYLSQPPDSIAYHIVTLLALQATLGLAWWQVRRRPDDDFARRLAWAAGVIFLSRLLILLALFATTGLVEAVAVLPPLERAMDTLAVAFLVWALSPQPRKLPRLGLALLLIVVIVIVFLYIFFATEWQAMVEAGTAPSSYATTQQAMVWSVVQMALLALGSALVLYARESQWSLRLVILSVLLAAQGLSLVVGASSGPTTVTVALWNRLGNVIAYPMLAVLAYRHNLGRMLPTGQAGRPAVDRLVDSLRLSGAMSSSLQPQQTVNAALDMVSELLPVRFAAIALINPERPRHLVLTGRLAGESSVSEDTSRQSRTRSLRRDDWTGLSQALREKQQVELSPDGPGARQIHEFNEALGLGHIDAMLIEPLFADSTELGLLLLYGGSNPSGWTDDQRELSSALGSTITAALLNAQRYQLALDDRAPEFERELADVSAKLEEARQERAAAVVQAAELDEQLNETRDRLDSNHQKLRQTTQALALTVNRQARVAQLEEELGALREALSEAELALAYAAAGQAGLSSEWVMRTVTRYSGELEEAQDQISDLEERLRRQDGREAAERAATQTRQLSGPLTAIGGYADLLLDPVAGEMTAQQETLLRRIRVNADKIIALVEAISASARSVSTEAVKEPWIGVRDALEEALAAVSVQLRSKSLRVDVSVDKDLPELQVNSEELVQLMVNALAASCLVSMLNGRIQVGATCIDVGAQPNGSSNGIRFLRLSIGDNGRKHSRAMYTAAIRQPSDPNTGRMTGEMSELANTLEAIPLLAAACGGRSWLDLSAELGGTLVFLLPLPARQYRPDEQER